MLISKLFPSVPSCRWYQNKQVQKVVKDSKIMGKVRTQIKLKDFKLKPTTSEDKKDCSEDGGDASKSKKPTNEELPKIIGSLDEYAKIVGGSAKGQGDPEKKAPESKAEESEEESDSEGDDGDLWGAIMGGARGAE